MLNINKYVPGGSPVGSNGNTGIAGGTPGYTPGAQTGGPLLNTSQCQPRGGVNWAVANALLAAGTLSSTAYAYLQAMSIDEVLAKGYISGSEYKALTGKDVPEVLRHSMADGFTIKSGWYNSPAVAAGTASVGATTAMLSFTSLNVWGAVVPAGFQIFKPTIELAARIIPSTGTLGLTLTNTNGGAVDAVIDWDNTTISAEDDNGNRSLNVAGQLRRANINAQAEAIAADTFAYRYTLTMNRYES